MESESKQSRSYGVNMLIASSPVLCNDAVAVGPDKSESHNEPGSPQLFLRPVPRAPCPAPCAPATATEDLWRWCVVLICARRRGVFGLADGATNHDGSRRRWRKASQATPDGALAIDHRRRRWRGCPDRRSALPSRVRRRRRAASRPEQHPTRRRQRQSVLAARAPIRAAGERLTHRQQWPPVRLHRRWSAPRPPAGDGSGFTPAAASDRGWIARAGSADCGDGGCRHDGRATVAGNIVQLEIERTRVCQRP